MKRILLFAFVLSNIMLMNAQFSGLYVPSNWTTTWVYPGATNGSVNTSGAPGTLVINGDNDCSGNTDQQIDYSITVPFCGNITFDYNWVSTDPGDNEYFYYGVNGSYTLVENQSNSGSISPSIPVLAGDVFSFVIYSDDDCNGAGSVTITNFSAPTAAIVAPDVPTMVATINPTCTASSSTTINITGNLNGAVNWHVYSGSCGGVVETQTPFNSFIVSPAVTTTYFVRGEGNCLSAGACGTITIIVGDNVDPTIICPADINTLTTSGDTALGVVLGTPTTGDNCAVASTVNDHPSTSYLLGATNVTWTVTDATGNTATCVQTVTVTLNNGLEDEMINELVIYPNPTKDYFSIMGGADEVKMYNLLGEQIQVQRNADIFSLGNIPAGIYYVAISRGQHKWMNKIKVE